MFGKITAKTYEDGTGSEEVEDWRRTSYLTHINVPTLSCVH